MNITRFEVKGKKALMLSVFKVEPKETPIGIIHFFHGLGEHKERYLPFAEYMAEQGYVVYAHDHRKHGASLVNPEDLGVLTREETWIDIIDDCYLVSRQIKKEQPKVPYTVIGPDLGSIIVRCFLAKYDNIAQRAVIMAPYPKTSKGALTTNLLGNKMRGMFGKKDAVSTKTRDALNKQYLSEYEEPRTEYDWRCNDEAVVDEFVNDPLCGFAYSTHFYNLFMSALIDVTKNDRHFEINDLPLLFIGGTEDPVCDYGSAVKEMRGVYSGFAFVQLQYKLFNGMKHDLFHEPEKQQVYDYLLKWLQKD